jgi:hypothetical protein
MHRSIASPEGKNVRKSQTLGLQLCGVGMLLALAAGAWGYLVEPAAFVFILAGSAAVVGLAGIALLGFDFLSARRS